MFNWKVVGTLLFIGSLSAWSAATKYIDADGIKNPAHTKTWTMPASSGTLARTADNVATATALAANPAACPSYAFVNDTAANGDLTCTTIPNLATTATSANTVSTIVARDGSGDFSAGTITAALSGNASTATTAAALTANPADCGANTFATTIAANGDLTCAGVPPAAFTSPVPLSQLGTTGTISVDFIKFSSQTTPVSPAPSVFQTYFKSDGNLYKLNNAGTENRIGGGALVVTGSRASPQAIVAGTGISYVATSGERQLWFVEGSGGHVDITANPQIVVGTTVGQELVVVCRNNDQTVTFDDGTGLSLNGQFVCAADSSLGMFWDGSSWSEMFRRQ